MWALAQVWKFAQKCAAKDSCIVGTGPGIEICSEVCCKGLLYHLGTGPDVITCHCSRAGWLRNELQRTPIANGFLTLRHQPRSVLQQIHVIPKHIYVLHMDAGPEMCCKEQLLHLYISPNNTQMQAYRDIAHRNMKHLVPKSCRNTCEDSTPQRVKDIKVL